MKLILAAVAIGLTVGAMPVMAEGEHGAALSYNLSVASEYRYRGISQTNSKPALQGGADYEFGHGFYVGAWASTISWTKDAGGGGNVEVDLFGGYKKEIAKDLLLDVGLLSYVYPSNGLKQRQHARVLRRADLRTLDCQVLTEHRQCLRLREQQVQRLYRVVSQLRSRRRLQPGAAYRPPEREEQQQVRLHR